MPHERKPKLDIATLLGPAPCDDCPMALRCASGLACAQFLSYYHCRTEDIWRTRDKRPTKETYRQIYGLGQ